jgi:hypothetical protein
MFTTTGVDVGKAITAAIAAGVVTGGLLAGALWLISLIGFFMIVLLIALQAGAGYLVGETVRRAAGYKMSRRLQYVAGAGAFLSYISAIGILLVLPLANPAPLIGIIGLIGMGISVYIAMGRVRP